MLEDINITALAKGNERFIVIYTDRRAAEAIHTVGRWAFRPDLNITPYDAAVLAQRIRGKMKKAGAGIRG